METAQVLSTVLADIMQRRYIAAIDIARELGVSATLVGRWVRGEAAPSADDVARLASRLGGEDGERLRQAAAQGLAEVEARPDAAKRTLCDEERVAVQGLPALFRDAFADAIGREQGDVAGA